MAQVLDGRLAGLEAAMAQEWERAYELLSSADAEGLLGPADLEVLAEAAVWSGRMGDQIAILERAFAGHGADDRGGAMALLASLEMEELRRAR